MPRLRMSRPLPTPMPCSKGAVTEEQRRADAEEAGRCQDQRRAAKGLSSRGALPPRNNAVPMRRKSRPLPRPMPSRSAVSPRSSAVPMLRKQEAGHCRVQRRAAKGPSSRSALPPRSNAVPMRRKRPSSRSALPLREAPYQCRTGHGPGQRQVAMGRRAGVCGGRGAAPRRRGRAPRRLGAGQAEPSGNRQSGRSVLPPRSAAERAGVPGIR